MTFKGWKWGFRSVRLFHFEYTICILEEGRGRGVSVKTDEMGEVFVWMKITRVATCPYGGDGLTISRDA